MKRRRLGPAKAATVLWLWALLFLGGPAIARPRLEPETEYLATLKYVIDCDTLKVEIAGRETSFRVVGVDYFESRLNARSGRRAADFKTSEEHIVEMGRISKRFVEAESRGVRKVRIKTHKKTFDRCGRVLATAYLPDETDLTEKILRSGFGIEPFSNKRGEYAAAYEEARKGGRCVGNMGGGSGDDRGGQGAF